MIEQVSKAVKFIAFFIEDKIGKTGLTVTVDVRGHDGSEIVTAASATEIGDGFYSYTLSSGSTANEGVYLCVFKTATTSVDQQHIPSLWCIGVAGVERLDATVSSRNATTPPTAAAVADAVWDEALTGHATGGSAGAVLSAAGGAADPLLNAVPGSYPQGTAGNALGRIGTGDIVTVSPVAASGNMSIVSGDDYLSTDNRALTWTGEFPDLDGATVTVCIQGEHYDATATDDTITLELTDTETAAMGVYSSPFWISATLANGSHVTLLTGTATVSPSC